MLIAALVVAGVAAVIYLAYGLTIIWQDGRRGNCGVPTGTPIGSGHTGHLLLIRIFFTKRELKKCQARVEELEHRLQSESQVKTGG